KEIQYLNAKGALTYTDIAGDPVLYGSLPPREISMKDVFRSGDSSKKFKSKLLMLICILTKNVITSCSVTMMLFLHLEVKPLMTLTTVLYLSCALISGHLAMMLMELTKRR